MALRKGLSQVAGSHTHRLGAAQVSESFVRSLHFVELPMFVIVASRFARRGCVPTRTVMTMGGI